MKFAPPSLLGAVLVFAVLAGPADAPAQSASTTLYQATVPMNGNTERGRTEAFEEAMRRVLVQATGRAGAFDEPGLAPVVREAARYVQRYRQMPDGQLFVGFDARRIERLIAAADPSQVRELKVAINGIGAVGAYAEVTAFLESLALMRKLQVEEVAGETVVYRAQVRGEMQKVAQAIEQNAHLLPAGDTGANAAGAVLRYRYSP